MGNCHSRAAYVMRLLKRIDLYRKSWNMHPWPGEKESAFVLCIGARQKILTQPLDEIFDCPIIDLRRYDVLAV
jgi:hypothetical protein